MNSQEWRHSLYLDYSQEDKRKYLVTVGFTAKKHSTYHQDLVFGFLNWPVYLQRLCADYLHTKDYERIQRATNYQQSQIPLRWKEPYEFYSPFMPHANPREINLSRIYPYPDRQSFVLTQNTLSDNRLTPRNYRGRMHEMITLEEIARHEQLSRYNQISWLRLMAHYVLFNSDASTIAKYTPPGELFAQVRFFLAFRRLFAALLPVHRARIRSYISYCMVCPNFLANVYIHFYITHLYISRIFSGISLITFTPHLRLNNKKDYIISLVRLYSTREIYCNHRSHSVGTSWRIRRAADSYSAAVIAFYSSYGARKQSITSSKLISKIRVRTPYMSD